MFGIGIPELLVIAIIGIVIVLPFWKIFTKAGFSGWLSLLMLVPFISIFALFYLAFAEWPRNNRNDLNSAPAPDSHVNESEKRMRAHGVECERDILE